MKDNKRFNEDTLQQEIEKVWGAYGAHMDVYSFMRRELDRLGRLTENRNARVKELEAAIELLARSHSPILARAEKAEAEVARLTPVMEAAEELEREFDDYLPFKSRKQRLIADLFAAVEKAMEPKDGNPMEGSESEDYTFGKFDR